MVLSENVKNFEKYDGVNGFKVYGNDRFVYQYIAQNYPEEEIKFDISKIKVITIDIEVAPESGFPDVFNCAEELLLIIAQDYNTKQIITFGSRPANITQKNVKFIQCKDEYDLIGRFMDWWTANPPEVVTGWNNELHDMPYLAGRMSCLMGEKFAKRLSPWNVVRVDEVTIMGRKQLSCRIAGVSILDYLDLYKKSPATPNQESYRLDHIAFMELGQNKLITLSSILSESSILTISQQKFVEYNIVDVELVDRLEDKLKLIDLCFTRAFDAKVNFNDIAYQVRTWDAIIYNYLLNRNIVIPQKERNSKSEKYAGAFVKEPIPGSYEWVVNFDLNSVSPLDHAVQHLSRDFVGTKTP